MGVLARTVLHLRHHVFRDTLAEWLPCEPWFS